MDWTHPDHECHQLGPWRAGRGPSIAVVAAKTGEGIFRAIYPLAFDNSIATTKRLVESINLQIGALRPGVEWTGYSYPAAPHYLYYGGAEGWPDHRDIDEPEGVWLFRWSIPPCEKYIGRTENKGVLLGPLVGRR